MMGEMNAVPEIESKYVVPPRAKVSAAAALDQAVVDRGWD